jgi:hypothetical protein
MRLLASPSARRLLPLPPLMQSPFPSVSIPPHRPRAVLLGE